MRLGWCCNVLKYGRFVVCIDCLADSESLLGGQVSLPRVHVLDCYLLLARQRSSLSRQPQASLLRKQLSVQARAACRLVFQLFLGVLLVR